MLSMGRIPTFPSVPIAFSRSFSFAFSLPAYASDRTSNWSCVRSREFSSLGKGPCLGHCGKSLVRSPSYLVASSAIPSLAASMPLSHQSLLLRQPAIVPHTAQRLSTTETRAQPASTHRAASESLLTWSVTLTQDVFHRHDFTMHPTCCAFPNPLLSPNLSLSCHRWAIYPPLRFSASVAQPVSPPPGPPLALKAPYRH